MSVVVVYDLIMHVMLMNMLAKPSTLLKLVCQLGLLPKRTHVDSLVRVEARDKIIFVGANHYCSRKTNAGRQSLKVGDF